MRKDRSEGKRDREKNAVVPDILGTFDISYSNEKIKKKDQHTVAPKELHVSSSFLLSDF